MKKYGLIILGIVLILFGIIIKLFDNNSSYKRKENGSGSRNNEVENNEEERNTPVVDLKTINLKEIRHGKNIECTRDRLLGESFYNTIKVLEEGGDFDTYPIGLQTKPATKDSKGGWEEEVGMIKYSELYEFDESGTKLKGYYIVNDFVFESDLFTQNLVKLFFDKLVKEDKDNHCSIQYQISTTIKEIIQTCYGQEWIYEGDSMQEILTVDSILKNYSGTNSPYHCSVDLE